MLIKTTIEVGIDLDDPIGQCDDDHIKHILAIKYQGKCLREHYIQSIDRIIRRGETVVNQLSSSAIATLPIIVEVTAIVFLRHEIITGCLIKNINERANFITCESDNANVILRKTPMFNSLKVGQIISVQVATSQYAIGASKIAVSGMPYLPSGTAPIYKIVGAGPSIAKITRDVNLRIEFEEREAAALKAADSKMYAVFSSLCSAYVKHPEVESGMVLKLTDLEALSTRTYITRDPRLVPTEATVLAVDEAPKNRPWDLQSVYEVTFAEAAVAILEDYCAKLRIVREMIAVYSTPDLIKSHANLWNIYKMNKLDAK
jgi:3D (Asp-Asp-Asp) domain-containing protein